MSKKFGSFMKVATVVAGVAAVGTACYIYKDKIKEFFQKAEIKDKLDTAKSFVTDKVLGTKDEDFFDDAEFFDDDAEAAEDNTNRGYTSIAINSEESTTEPAKAVEPVKRSVAETVAAKKEEPTELTFSAKKETVASEEDTPFEYEGLSDVSEDDDVLAEEASLDGTF